MSTPVVRWVCVDHTDRRGNPEQDTLGASVEAAWRAGAPKPHASPQAGRRSRRAPRSGIDEPRNRDAYRGRGSRPGGVRPIHSSRHDLRHPRYTTASDSTGACTSTSLHGRWQGGLRNRRKPPWYPSEQLPCGSPASSALVRPPEHAGPRTVQCAEVPIIYQVAHDQCSNSIS